MKTMVFVERSGVEVSVVVSGKVVMRTVGEFTADTALTFGEVASAKRALIQENDLQIVKDLSLDAFWGSR